jgi:hypothetical protein
MRSPIRHVLVWLVALAFVASGAAWRHCMAAQQPIPVAVQGTHDHSAHSSGAHDHASHDHGSPHHADADQNAADNQAADQAGHPAGNHDCGKCCSICTISGAMPPALAETAFEVSAVVFASERDTFAGNSIPVDPGVPKLIA